MAQVPDPSVPQVTAPEQAPLGQQDIHATPQDFGAAIAHGTMQFGQGLQQAGQDVTGILVNRQERFNQIATDDAFNKFQTGADNLTYGDPTNPQAPKGLYTLRGADALNAGPGTVQSLSSLRDQIKGGLQNDAQRLQFDEQSRRLLEYKSAEISRHLDSQQDAYGMAVNKASTDAAVRSASLAYNSDDAISHSIQDARASSVKAAQIQLGASAGPDVVNNAMAIGQTQAIKGAIEGALADNNPMRAGQIMDKFGPLLDPATRQNLARETNTHRDIAGVAGTADTVINGVSPQQVAAGAQMNSLWSRLKGVESGGNDSAVSPKGAIGRTQLIPSTAAMVAAQHNISFDPAAYKTDPSANEVLGRLYLQDNLQRYNGNATLATAAYNAGPANVDKWIAQNGDPRNGSISDAQWASQIPLAETKNYVAKVALPSTIPSSMPTHNPDAYGTEEQMIQQAKVAAAKQFPDRPDLQDAVVNKVYQHINQANILQSKQDAATQKQKQDAQQEAANNVVTAFQTNVDKFDPATITNNPALTYEQKLHLMDAYHTEKNRQSAGGPGHYGPQFDQLYTQATAPVGNPTRLTDPSELWQHMAKGDITPAGYEKINAEMMGRKTPDGEGEVQAKKSFLDEMKTKISINNVMGTNGRDPVGEHNWSQFTLRFFPKYEEGKAKGLTPQQMLDPKSPEYLGNLAGQPGQPGSLIRTHGQMVNDFMTANSGSSEDDANAAIPAAAPAAPKWNTQQLQQEMIRRGLMKDPTAAPPSPVGPQVPIN